MVRTGSAGVPSLTLGLLKVKGAYGALRGTTGVLILDEASAVCLANAAFLYEV